MTSDWSKKTFLRYVLSKFAEIAASHGFQSVPQSPFFIRRQSDEVQATIGIQVITAKLPASVISLDVDAAIQLVSVAKICEELFGRSVKTPVIGAPIGRFTERNDSLTEYRFDWLLPEERQFIKVQHDIAAFAKFAADIESVSELKLARLQRLPNLRKNFSDGLGESYRFTVPEVAAVIHKLNVDQSLALAAFEAARHNKSGRLNSEQLGRLAGYLGISS